MRRSDSGSIAWIGALDLDYIGFIVVGLLVLTWVVALVVWRVAKGEERWCAAMERLPSNPVMHDGVTRFTLLAEPGTLPSSTWIRLRRRRSASSSPTTSGSASG